MIGLEKFYNVAIHEKYTKQDIKKMLQSGSLLAFNTTMQTLPKQKDWVYRSDLDLKEGDIVEVPFGISDITYYGCVVGLTSANRLENELAVKKIYNKVNKLSLNPIM